MSQLEILSPHCPVDILNSNSHSDSYSGSFHSWSGKSIHDFFSKSPTSRVVDTLSADNRVVDDEAIFPGLPPLRNGHPDVQLRNGIMRASRLTLANEPDAEKAFFVADLSQVYHQHQRWKRCLPEIEPHYGRQFIHMPASVIPTVHFHFQPSSATRTLTSSGSSRHSVPASTARPQTKLTRCSASAASTLPESSLPILARPPPSSAVLPNLALTR